MGYRIFHAADGAIELTKIDEAFHSNPVRVAKGTRDRETGWSHAELLALGEHENYPLKHKVLIRIV